MRPENLIVEPRRLEHSGGDGLESGLAAQNQPFPEPLAVVTNRKHREVVSTLLFLLPVLLEGDHVRVWVLPKIEELAVLVLRACGHFLIVFR